MDKKINSSLLFSIIIPVYNVEVYIKDCIDSVLRQECKEYEMILIDDGSIDYSGNICDEYSEKYPDIHVIHQDNQGLSGARNMGIRYAKGKYLVYLDSDDMMAPGALQNLKQAVFEQNDPPVILSRRITYESGKTTECQYYFDKYRLLKLKPGQAYSVIQDLPDMWLGVWIFTTRRDYILDNRFYFYEGIFHEDEEWVPKIFLNADKIGYNNSCVYVNRINRAGSIMATPNIKREFDKLKIIELLQNEFTEDKYPAETCEVVAKRVQSIYFGVLCEMNIYRYDKQFSQLENEMKTKKQLLKTATKGSHRLGRVLIALFGVERAGRLLKMVRKLL